VKARSTDVSLKAGGTVDYSADTHKQLKTIMHHISS